MGVGSGKVNSQPSHENEKDSMKRPEPMAGGVGKSGRIYVGNVPKYLGEPDVRRLFEAFGPLKEVRMIPGDQPPFNGYGFVEYHRDKEAETAIQKMNGYNLEGSTLKVRWASEPGKKNTT